MWGQVCTRPAPAALKVSPKEPALKKIREWMFVALLVALAAAGGWLKERQGSSLADANIEANLG